MRKADESHTHTSTCPRNHNITSKTSRIREVFRRFSGGAGAGAHLAGGRWSGAPPPRSSVDLHGVLRAPNTLANKLINTVKQLSGAARDADASESRHSLRPTPHRRPPELIKSFFVKQVARERHVPKWRNFAQLRRKVRPEVVRPARSASRYRNRANLNRRIFHADQSFSTRPKCNRTYLRRLSAKKN